MSLEVATYIAELNANNPGATDLQKQGDDHLRLIKDTLKNTFPNADRAMYFEDLVAETSVSATLVSPTDGGKYIPVDASGGNKTMALPPSPTDGLLLTIFKSDYSLSTVTISGNGKNINGETTQVLYKAYQKIRLLYSSILGAWIGDIDTIVPVGTFLHNGAASVPGYLLADGTTTIGSASSGADLAATKYRSLFEHLWNTYSNTVCPVTPSGHGANAAADWTANKKIRMPNLVGRVLVAKDGSAAVLTSPLDAATVGNAIGEDKHVLTEAELAAHNHDFTGTAVADHKHFMFEDATENSSSATTDATHQTAVARNLGSDNDYRMPPRSGAATVGLTSAAGGHTPAGTIADAGSGTGHNNVQPSFVTNIHMAL